MATTKKKTETASVSKENIENNKIVDKEKELLKNRLGEKKNEKDHCPASRAGHGAFSGCLQRCS